MHWVSCREEQKLTFCIGMQLSHLPWHSLTVTYETSTAGSKCTLANHHKPSWRPTGDLKDPLLEFHYLKDTIMTQAKSLLTFLNDMLLLDLGVLTLFAVKSWLTQPTALKGIWLQLIPHQQTSAACRRACPMLLKGHFFHRRLKRHTQRQTIRWDLEHCYKQFLTNLIKSVLALCC